MTPERELLMEARDELATTTSFGAVRVRDKIDALLAQPAPQRSGTDTWIAEAVSALKDWRSTELDAMDDEFMPWVEQFEKRVDELLSAVPVPLSETAASDAAKVPEAYLLPGLREALLWKPNIPQLENAMTYAWESALKSFIRSLENAAPSPDEKEEGK